MTVLEQKYQVWKDTHPTVMDLFRRLARAAARRGRRFGIDLLTARVRWEILMAIEPDAEGCRVNNNHRAYIARDLIAEMPMLGQLISIRKKACERQKFPNKWMAQVNGPRKIPTARPYPSRNVAA